MRQSDGALGSDRKNQVPRCLCIYVRVHLAHGLRSSISYENSTGFTEYSLLLVDSPVRDQASISVQATVFNKSSRLGLCVLCFTDRGLEQHHHEKHCKGNTIVRRTDRLPSLTQGSYVVVLVHQSGIIVLFLCKWLLQKPAVMQKHEFDNLTNRSCDDKGYLQRYAEANCMRSSVR